MPDSAPPRRLRSRRWFDDQTNPGMTALYLERYMNFGLTPSELRSGRPIVGIAQTGSDLSPCNRHHLALAERVRDGIRDAGGVPIEFPIHPIQETGKRPTAALDRNLAYLSLVEVLHGYPIDGVGADRRLRQDRARGADGRGDGQHPLHPAVWRADAGRVVQRAAGRVRDDRLGGPQAARRGEDQLRGVPRHGGRFRLLGRPLQHDGHGAQHEQPGRGARHVAAGLRRHPRPAQGARLDGLRDRPAHRRHGRGEPAPVRHHDQGGVRERRGRRRGARRQQQLPDQHDRHRPAHGRGPHARRLAAARRGHPAADRRPARRTLSRRGLLPRRRRARGDARAPRGGKAAARRDERAPARRSARTSSGPSGSIPR